MKKTYMIPSSEQLNMETEQMIAASGLNIHANEHADQWTEKKNMWGKENMWDN